MNFIEQINELVSLNSKFEELQEQLFPKIKKRINDLANIEIKLLNIYGGHRQYMEAYSISSLLLEDNILYVTYLNRYYENDNCSFPLNETLEEAEKRIEKHYKDLAEKSKNDTLNAKRKQLEQLKKELCET